MYGYNALCDVQTWKERQWSSAILPLSERHTVQTPFIRRDGYGIGQRR